MDRVVAQVPQWLDQTAQAFDTTRKRAQQRARVSSKRDGGVSSYAGILGSITGARERGKKIRER